MCSATVQNKPVIDWGVAARALAGENVSGDTHVVQTFEDGVLLAAIDGLGHGEEATMAARLAADVLSEHADECVIALVKRCHEKLTQTRGVVMTLASLRVHEDTLTWLGVGNVEAWLIRGATGGDRPKESVLLRNGLVGFRLPALHAGVVPLQANDMLIFATDGIHPGFAEDLKLNESPQQMADTILGGHLKGTDDALVLVARYLGMHHE